MCVVAVAFDFEQMLRVGRRKDTRRLTLRRVGDALVGGLVVAGWTKVRGQPRSL